MIIKAPNKPPYLAGNPLVANKPTIFLAGSIEMGKATNWQEHAGRLLQHRFLVLNPRRDDWDATWDQSTDNPNFREQVEWELTGQEEADARLIYFDPDAKSPITLLELGLFVQYEHTVVVCPEGFWRKGNVDIVCERYGMLRIATLDEAVDYFLRDWKWE